VQGGLACIGDGKHLDEGISKTRLATYSPSLIFPWAQKVTNVDDINQLVSPELPVIENAELYEIVTNCLLHGPCGPGYPNARCMVDGMCKKHYLREYSEVTMQGEDGYVVYRRRNDGRTF